jgi:hypothetical protein
MQRQGLVAWYRNPSVSGPDSRGIADTVNSEYKNVRPDFLFFSKQSDGTVAADIVDPYGTHFNDALPKLQGLAHYAETHAAIFRRVEAIAKVGDRLWILDLTEPAAREAVAKDVKSLYEGSLASSYDLQP